MLAVLVAYTGALPVSTSAGAQAAGCTSPADCLSKMTLDEKLGQMTMAVRSEFNPGGNPLSDITTYSLGSVSSGGGPNGPADGGTASQWADMYDALQSYALKTRLGIPLVNGTDSGHGHSNVQGTVIFPHHIGMGATRDAALVQQVDTVTRNEMLGTGINWVFGPCVCVPRDDRWGRTYEGYSEDTATVQAMAAASIMGFQSSGLGTSTVMATAKHFVADGGTAYGTGSTKFGFLIDQGDARITEAQLRAIHLPPFQTAIANNVGSVMISFSSWNGVKDHANQWLITTLLKGELGFRGFVVSDWAAIDQISPDYPTAVRASVNAGIDMFIVPTNFPRFISTLRGEVTAGRVSQARIDDAVTRILTQKFALGLFTKNTTDRSYTAQVGSAAHRAIARQAVRESMVLLKNTSSVLPLSKTGTYKIVVGGSHADDLGYQVGGLTISWQGASGPTTTGTTFWQALQAARPAGVTLLNVGTATGGTYNGDIGIAVIGETPYAEGVGDSATLAVSSANATQVSDICSRTTSCVVILISGRPLIINTQLSQSAAIVAAWLPGTEGAGMTDVLFGDAPFTGTLPVTWPSTLSQEPINAGDGQVGLFPFGFGLTGGSTATATPTASATATSSPTSTSTSTATPTATATLSPTSTATATATPSPTTTSTSTVAPTATASATPTPRPIPSATATATPTSTPVPTATPSATLTSTPIPTATATLTPTATLAPSPTATPPQAGLVQTAILDTSGTTGSLAPSSAVSSGDLLVAAIRIGNSAGIANVTDNNGNTWQVVDRRPDTGGGGGEDFELWYAPNALASPNSRPTVTITSTRSATLRVVLAEYRGVLANSALDRHATAIGNSAAPLVSSSTTSQPNELVLGYAEVENTSTFTARAGYLVDGSVPSSAGKKLALEHLVTTTAGVQTAGFTVSSQAWGMGIATFRTH